MSNTTPIDFDKVIPVPDIKTVIDPAAKTQKARTALKGTENKFNGKGRSSSKTEGDVIEPDAPIDLDSILAESTVEPLTMEYFEQLIGNKRVDKGVKERALKFINDNITSTNPAIGEYFRNVCIDAASAIFGAGSRISLLEYMQAALFVTYRQSGDTQLKAYVKTFPERVMRLQAEGQNQAHLAVYASIFAKTKAVTEIQAKMLVPTHIMCHDLFYQALRVTTDIMMDDKVSPKVRVEAAAQILNHTKSPEIKQHELSIKVNESNEIEQLKEAMYALSKQQQQSIIEGECTVVDVNKAVIYQEENDDKG